MEPKFCRLKLTLSGQGCQMIRDKKFSVRFLKKGLLLWFKVIHNLIWKAFEVYLNPYFELRKPQQLSF